MRIALVNSFIARPGLYALAEASSLGEAGVAAACGATSFISSPRIANILGVRISTEKYIPKAGDIAYIVTWRARDKDDPDDAYILDLRRRFLGAHESELFLEDIEVLRVKYAHNLKALRRLAGKSIYDLIQEGRVYSFWQEEPCRR